MNKTIRGEERKVKGFMDNWKKRDKELFKF